MEARGGGSIILIASQLGRVARAGRPWYCAAKGALIQLAKAMALDHAGQNIRVNSLSPGPVETARYLRNFDTLDAARASHHTLVGRLGSPEEIAAGAVYLAGDESTFVTGADLLIYMPIAAISLLLMLFFVKPLNALLLGQSYAQNAGVDFKKSRFWLILIASVLTGITTAFCGPIAFIGTSVPILSRMLFKTSRQPHPQRRNIHPLETCVRRAGIPRGKRDPRRILLQ